MFLLCFNLVKKSKFPPLYPDLVITDRLLCFANSNVFTCMPASLCAHSFTPTHTNNLRRVCIVVGVKEPNHNECFSVTSALEYKECFLQRGLCIFKISVFLLQSCQDRLLFVGGYRTTKQIKWREEGEIPPLLLATEKCHSICQVSRKHARRLTKE